jgi:hypothetical protein
VAALVVLVSILGGYLDGWEWTGLVKEASFPKRTLWDWLKLLIIPASIAGGTLWFNWQQQAFEEVEGGYGHAGGYCQGKAGIQ